jgi:tetratricopeptide (TPR) repeat protein
MEDPLKTLHSAVVAYNAGKLAEAERLCQRIMTAQQGFFDALHLLALAQLRLGKREMALTNFDRAVALQPNLVEALSNRGALLQDLKRYDEALVSFDRALAVRHDHAEALSNRGLTLHELGRYDEALLSYDLPNTTHQDAVWLAERLRAAVESNCHRVGEHTVRATVSVGVVTLSNETTADLAELLGTADQALYRAKDAGRNCVKTLSYTAGRSSVRPPDELSIQQRTAA